MLIEGLRPGVALYFLDQVGDYINTIGVADTGCSLP